MNRYIVKVRETGLWMKVTKIYSGHMYSTSENSFTWVTSPLEASRYDTAEAANEVAGVGIPKGHWTLHRILDLTEPVYEFTSDKEEKPLGVIVKVEHVTKPCWFIRKLCGG
jgi:hypothetical protein